MSSLCEAAWLTKGIGDIWRIPEGQDYPRLWWKAGN
jgi:hypothetical protein